MSLAFVRDRRFARVVRDRDLTLLLSAGLVSQTGDWILATGVGFEVYAITGSTLASAAVLIATRLPQVLLGPVAGVMVDRWDRRRTMIAVNGVLALLLVPMLLVGRSGPVWPVIVVVAASSCLTPFFTAAEASLLPALVREDDLLITANAVNGQMRNVARLVGAALGGVAVEGGGFTVLAIADLATFLVAAALLALIRHRARSVTLPRLRPLRDWLEGLATIRRSRELVVLLLFFALSGIGEAIMGTLFAPFVRDVLRGGGELFGAVNAAQAVGGIAGGVLVTAVGHRFPPRTLFGGGAVAFGALDGVLFLYHLAVPQAWPALLVIALVGLPGAAMSAGMLTVFQVATDDVSRGRVFGAMTTAQNALMLGGSAIAASFAAHLGVLPVITLQAVVYVVGGLLVLAALRTRTASPAPTAIA